MSTAANSPTPPRDPRPSSTPSSPTLTSSADTVPVKDIDNRPTTTTNTDAVISPTSLTDATRASGRLQKRNADAAARSTERKKKHGRAKNTAASDSGTSSLQPTPRKAPGKQRAGSAARAEHKARPAAPPSPPADAPPESVPSGPPSSRHVDLTDETAHDSSALPLDTSGTALADPFELSNPGASATAHGALPQLPVDTRFTTAGGGDLAAFLADGAHAATFQPGLAATSCGGEAGAAPPSVTVAALSAQVLALQELVVGLSRRLEPNSAPSLQQQQQHYPTALQSSTAGQSGLFDAQRGSWTLPAGDGVIPPPQLVELRSSSFPSATTRVKGDYAPHLSHILAAHRTFLDMFQPNGTFVSPMFFVLTLRERDCVQFDTAPAVLMAFYSGRVGSRGLSVLHFRPLSMVERLTRGSSNINFAADFGATAPHALPACKSYDDILLALTGLGTAAAKLWYDHMNRLLARLRQFVLDNQAADPANDPARVTLTLQYVNMYIGSALGHLADDSQHWWRNFIAAVASIEFHSIEWLMSLQELAHHRNRHDGATASIRRPTMRSQSGMPDHVRQLIPRRADGKEPCLRYFGGGMCFGGTRERCAFSFRTYRWPDPLPRELQQHITTMYGTARRPNGPRRN